MRKSRKSSLYDTLFLITFIYNSKIYSNYNIGTTVWSALDSGFLTGKYSNGIPTGSRFDIEKSFFSQKLKDLESPEGQEKIRKVKELTKLAEDGMLSLSRPCSDTYSCIVYRTPDNRCCPCPCLGCTEPKHLHGYSRRDQARAGDRESQGN